MPSPANLSDTVTWLSDLSRQINQYLPLPYLIFGTIGIVLNSIIFTRRILVRNSCTHYLLGNTVANFFVLYWVTILRLFSDGYQIDPTITANSLCKLRYFLTYVPRTLSTWFIVLACIDRWISSIQVQRRFCSVNFARTVILVTTIICMLSYCHIFVCFGIQKTSTSIICYAPPGSYRIFSDFQYLIFYALGPPLAMLIFGLATLRNYRRSHMQVSLNDSSQTSSRNRSRRDTQILAMLLMQVAMIIVFTVPFSVEKLYETFTANVKNSPVQTAEVNLTAAIVRILSYGPHALGFFAYTLSARIFRFELLKIFHIIYEKIRGRTLNAVTTGNFHMTQIHRCQVANVHDMNTSV